MLKKLFMFLVIGMFTIPFYGYSDGLFNGLLKQKDLYGLGYIEDGKQSMASSAATIKTSSNKNAQGCKISGEVSIKLDNDMLTSMGEIAFAGEIINALGKDLVPTYAKALEKQKVGTLKDADIDFTKTSNNITIKIELDVEGDNVCELEEDLKLDLESIVK